MINGSFFDEIIKMYEKISFFFFLFLMYNNICMCAKKTEFMAFLCQGKIFLKSAQKQEKYACQV